MIVNKPQFDTDKIKPGQAYWFKKKDYRHYNVISTPCIILKVQPLAVLLSYYDEDNKSLAQHNVTIEDVVDKKFTLEEMSVVND
jgi:hypothetical protein